MSKPAPLCSEEQLTTQVNEVGGGEKDPGHGWGQLSGSGHHGGPQAEPVLGTGGSCVFNQGSISPQRVKFGRNKVK